MAYELELESFLPEEMLKKLNDCIRDQKAYGTRFSVVDLLQSWKTDLVAGKLPQTIVQEIEGAFCNQGILIAMDFREFLAQAKGEVAKKNTQKNHHRCQLRLRMKKNPNPSPSAVRAAIPQNRDARRRLGSQLARLDRPPQHRLTHRIPLPKRELRPLVLALNKPTISL